MPQGSLRTRMLVSSTTGPSCRSQRSYPGAFTRVWRHIVNELVELLNRVDTTYRTELREQNELNFARFDAKLDQRVAEVRGEIAALRWESAALRSDLRAEMQSFKAEMIKWMFLFWVGTLLGGYLLK
jgi:hypothetical protein